MSWQVPWDALNKSPHRRDSWSRVVCVCWMLLLAALTGCATNAPPTPGPYTLNPETLQQLRLPRKVFVTQVQAPSAPTPFVMRPLWQVVVQREGDALRWLRFDLLGVPDARQMLENGRWRNDGFISPNGEAREMFAALLFAWLQDTDLDVAYGTGRWLYRDAARGGADAEMDLLTHASDDQPRWTVMWPNRAEADTFSILRHRDGVRWDVRPVPEKP